MKFDGAIPTFGLYGELQKFPDVVHCEAFSARAPLHQWHITVHRHPQMSQLFVIDDGLVTAKTDSTAWELSSGEFLYIPEDCAHGFDFEPGTTGWVYSFPSSVVRSIAPGLPELSAILSVPFSGAFSGALQQITKVLFGIEKEKLSFRQQIAVALTHSILSLLAEIQRQTGTAIPGTKSDRILQLDRLISAHTANGWSAADYAYALSISTSHLSRLCRQSSGLGAAAYIERKIMSEACRLLAFTTLPISEIGYRSGYSDPSYFSKRFNKAQGQAPSDYRAKFTS